VLNADTEFVELVNTSNITFDMLMLPKLSLSNSMLSFFLIIKVIILNLLNFVNTSKWGGYATRLTMGMFPGKEGGTQALALWQVQLHLAKQYNPY
jgi:hypothetical protein